MTQAQEFIADLHLHSTASDGELNPDSLVDAAKEAGLAAMAITDHDTVSGIQAALTRGQERGIEVIPGCELTAYAGETELHILGLFIDPSAESAVSRLVEQIRKRRPERVLAITAKLRAAGVDLRDEEVLAETRKTKSPGRAHIAAALVRKGLVRDVEDAFDRYLDPGRPGYIQKFKFSPEVIITTIHESRGLAILAHPGRYLQPDLVRLLFAAGLDGVEINHHSHTPEDRVLYEKLALEHEKCTSGGSDFHGPRMKPGIHIRDFGATASMFAQLKKRALEVRGKSDQSL